MSSPDVRAQSARQKSGATTSLMCGVSAAAHLAADRWEALLDEAVRLASAGGYDAVQMRVIAKHAVRPWAHCIASFRRRTICWPPR